jgi:hypothetical protein
MRPWKKATLVVLGAIAALLIISQLVMGQLIVSGYADPKLIKAHQHTGYSTVVVALVYIAASLTSLITLPTRPKP